MTPPPDAPLVLVVEDYDDAREMYAAYLRLDGFRVEEAADGAEALRAVADRAPDAIVLDLSLPVVDGFETIRRLRDEPATRGIPIVALSGFPAARERDGGWDAFVTKPCMPEELIGAVRDVLGRGPGRPGVSRP
jgi:two-component system cell cycle response regulator DivK